MILAACFGRVKTRMEGWLPDMDLNHDKQIQSLLCYRYTIGQTACNSLDTGKAESRLEHYIDGASAHVECLITNAK